MATIISPRRSAKFRLCGWDLFGVCVLLKANSTGQPLGDRTLHAMRSRSQIFYVTSDTSQVIQSQ